MTPHAQQQIESIIDRRLIQRLRWSADATTRELLDKIFGDKLTISLTRFANLSGFRKSTLEDFIMDGSLKAISPGSHVYLSRMMVLDFLWNGAGAKEFLSARVKIEELTTRYKKQHQKRTRSVELGSDPK